MDIYVGILTRNTENTISNVIWQVDKGLLRYFPKDNCEIIICDGFSDDKTVERACAVKVKSKKSVLLQRGNKGKGEGIRTIFDKVNRASKERFALALVDGDLVNISPIWMKALIEPILEGNDLVTPSYVRDRYDASITNHAVIPFNYAVNNIHIHQPIGGEFGLSSKLIQKLLNHKLFPEDFGIDIFITTVAAMEDFKIVQSTMGTKIHESAKQHQNIIQLSNMFNQVVKTMFKLAKNYSFKTKRAVNPPILKYVTLSNKTNITMNSDKLIKDFKNLVKVTNIPKEYQDPINQLNVSSPEEFELCAKDWAKIFLRTFVRYDSDSAASFLVPFWIARFATFVKETKKLNDEQVTCLLNKQKEIFKEVSNEYKYSTISGG